MQKNILKRPNGNICAYKSVDIPNVVHGVNSADGKTDVFSCASCTTNISPYKLKSQKAINNNCTTHKQLVDPSKELEWDVQELTI
jgi:hypothetical protein